METRQTDSELSGWKQIADYLGVSERTARQYAKQAGMPIHRMPGAKGRVWVRPVELDVWKGVANHNQRPAETTIPYRTWDAALPRFFVPGVVFLALFSVGGLFAHFFTQPHATAALKAEFGTIVALDGSGRQIWQHKFPAPFTTDRLSEAWIRSRGEIYDLDGDGLPEVLFTYPRMKHPNVVPTMTLYCFSHTGEVLWTFEPGRAVSDGTERLEPPFFISNVQVIPTRGTEGPWIVVSSNHYLSHPDQIAVLDRRGKLVGEYWHSGHLLAMSHADVDGDGIEELVLGGVDNGTRTATLLVFDPRHVSGARQYDFKTPFQLQGFGPGTEKAMVLFPRSDLVDPDGFNEIFKLDTTPTRIMVKVTESRYADDHSSIIYEFDYHLALLGVTPLPEFLQAQRERYNQGILSHPWSNAELQNLIQHVVVTSRYP